jgi:Hg(II)-responsive transcriptional regulator
MHAMASNQHKSAALMSIGQLSRALDVGVDTIRYYERIGLLPPPQRTPAGYRMYAAADRQRLAFIRRTQELGFTLEDLAALLKLSQRGGSVAQARAIATEKLSAVRQKLVELERLRKVLESLVDRCPGAGDPAHCPIIGALTGAPPAARTGQPRKP